MSSRHIRFTLLLLAAASIFASCSKKITASTSTISREDLAIEEIDFEYLTLRSKIKFKEASSSKNATALIRMKRDSIIWFNLSGTLGVQGVRGILTKDSIKVINRVDKEYWLLDYETLSEEFNFKIDYAILQAMILGEMPKEKLEGESITRNDENFVIHQNYGDIYIDNYVSSANNKVTEVNILERPTQNSLKLLYGDFQQVNEQNFPFSSFVSLIHNNEFGELETQVDITHSKVEISNKEMKFPFVIPKKYARK